MAPTQTTTLRVPNELRDEIARLAAARGTTMLDVVAEAVERLRRDEWWESVRAALDELPDAHLSAYSAESRMLGASAPDGLDDH